MKGVVSTDVFVEWSGVVNPVWVQIAGVLDHTCWQERPKPIHFPKTKLELQKALMPLLRYANLVTLIDPYMTPTKPRFFDTIQHCVNLLGKHDG
jgi:hypothetical protein